MDFMLFVIERYVHDYNYYLDIFTYNIIHVSPIKWYSKFQGEELKRFCPSVFIFLATILPAIWTLELATDRRELLCLGIEKLKGILNIIQCGSN